MTEPHLDTLTREVPVRTAELPLLLPDLGPAGRGLMRSRPLWLKPDGYVCRANEPVVAFNLGLGSLASQDQSAFADERTLQVVLAPTSGGCLRIAETGQGSLHDIWSTYDWNHGATIGWLDVGVSDATTACALQSRFLAGRRASWAVDSDSTLLPGWNARARTWWGQSIAPANSLVSLGLCDASALVRGINADFGEFAQLAGSAFHVTHHSEHPLVFCAQILLEQMQRTDHDRREIARDLIGSLAEGSEIPSELDYQFVGALLARLKCSPISESSVGITANGVQQLRPPRFVLLSLLAESQTIYRHRRLGYHIHILTHTMQAAGAATKAMLRQNFVAVERSVDQIEASFRALASHAAEVSGARLIVINRNSSDSREKLFNYKGFKGDLSRKLRSVLAKELNVMLDILADEQILDIIDVDARGAQVGTAGHVPDGAHFSVQLETMLRRDLIDGLERRGAIVLPA